MTPLRRADQASTTHHHVLQKQATDNASALLFLNRFCCASRARRRQPRRSALEGGAPRRRAVSIVLHAGTTRHAVAAGRVPLRPTLRASRRSPPRKTPSTLEGVWSCLGVLRILAVTVSGLPVFLPASHTGAAAAPLRVGRRRAAAFMERSRCRLRSVFLLASFLPPKKPCAPCSSVAVFLAVCGEVRGAGGLRLRAALRRAIATVEREQHHPLCLAHFQTLETTRRVFSKALETPAWGRLRCVFRECLTAVVQ